MESSGASFGESSRPRNMRQYDGRKHQLLRWGVIATLVVAMVTYYVYVPVPDGVTEPWKARQILAMLRTIEHMALFSEKIGLASRLNATRSFIGSFSKILPKDYNGMKVEDTFFRGVKVRVYVPEKRKHHGPALVFYHGGGWVMCGIESHDHVTAALAQKLQMMVVSVEYRLSPEHPYPAPLEDCLKATRYFIEEASDRYQIDKHRVAVAGDSAGGNLAAAVALRLRDTPGAINPRLQVLVYPLLQAVDFHLPSYLQNDGAVIGTRLETASVALLYMAHDTKYSRDVIGNNHVDEADRRRHYQGWNISSLPRRFTENYQRPLSAGGRKPRRHLVESLRSYLYDPYCMPLMAERLDGLPPAVVLTAEYDVLRDDGALYGRRLAAAGVQVAWFHYPHSYHGMLAFIDPPMRTAEGVQMMDDLVAHLRTHL